jgi:hypothetical protein
VKIDDSTSGLYTDPAAATHLATAAPAGGAAYVPLDLTANGPTSGVNYFLPAPFTVSADSPSPPTIVVVADAIRTMQLDVTGGVASFRTGTLAPVVLFGTPSGTGAAEYYSQVGGVGSYNYSAPPVDNEQLRVYYAATDTPVAAFLSPATFALNGAAAYATDPAGGTGSRAGGYLGQDATKTLCWASATDFTWQTYSALFELPRATNVGDTAMLAEQDTSSPPAPGAGGTYAGACPAIVATRQLPLLLSAN